MNVSPEKIKQLRAEHGWSQEQLGEVAGLSYRTVQRIEKDGNGSPETIMAIASAFSVTPDELSMEYKPTIVQWCSELEWDIRTGFVYAFCRMDDFLSWKRHVIF